MIEVPNWDGNPKDPYPSVTLRLDFRGKDVGIFVFHCHILNHEDLGMMNIIQVVAPNSASAAASKLAPAPVNTSGAAKQTALAPSSSENMGNMKMKMK